MSDIEGKKPNSFRSFANKNQIGFLAIEYSGHGKSSGKFIEGNISLWTDDAKKLIKKIVKKNKFLIIGSSMGASSESPTDSPGESPAISEKRLLSRS